MLSGIKNQISTNVVAEITAKMFATLESCKINHIGTGICQSDIPTDIEKRK